MFFKENMQPVIKGVDFMFSENRVLRPHLITDPFADCGVSSPMTHTVTLSHIVYNLHAKHVRLLMFSAWTGSGWTRASFRRSLS